MPTRIDLEAAAAALKLNSGQWAALRTDTHNRIHAVLSKWRRVPPPALRGRFEYRVKSNGYGSHETTLLARHMPATFPIE